MAIPDEDKRLVSRFIVYEGIRNSEFENLHHAGLIKQVTIRPTLMGFEDTLISDFDSLSQVFPIITKSTLYSDVRKRSIDAFAKLPVQSQCDLLRAEALQTFYFDFSLHVKRQSGKELNKISVAVLKIVEDKFLSDYYIALSLSDRQKIKFKKELTSQFNLILPALDLILCIFYSASPEISQPFVTHFDQNILNQTGYLMTGDRRISKVMYLISK